VYLTTTAQVARLMDAARTDRRLGIDLEFIRERTYTPQLALVQVAVGEQLHLIDPLGEVDLAPILALVGDESVCKVVHAGSQDLEILEGLAGETPRCIFDTQIAAAFLGYGQQISYSGLVESGLGTSLLKGESYTDWLARPLSDAQERYAIDDVRYLLPLHDLLTRELEKNERLSWVEEEFLRYEDRKLYHPPPELLFRKVKRFGTLDPLGLTVLVELAKWREDEAKQRNRPRRSVITDDVLVEIARKRPSAIDDLQRMRGFHSRDIKRYGLALLDQVKVGLAVPVDERPRLVRRPKMTPEAEATTELLTATMRAISRGERLAAPLVCKADEIEELVRSYNKGEVDPGEHRVLSGWRGEVVGEKLLDFLSGKVCLLNDPVAGRPVFRPVDRG